MVTAVLDGETTPGQEGEGCSCYISPVPSLPWAGQEEHSTTSSITHGNPALYTKVSLRDMPIGHLH